MNDKGQLAGWEAVIILILLAYSGYITYLWASKQSETKVFQKGSNARIFEPSPHFGCSTFKIEEYYEGRLHANINKNNGNINPSSNMRHPI